jgi:hypothetical protein
MEADGMVGGMGDVVWSVVDVENVEVHSMYHDDMSAVVSRLLIKKCFLSQNRTLIAIFRLLSPVPM